MSSLEAEEALLKRKLEDTDNLEERREIRKQLRELRNKKFEEEIKKVSATDYRPGRDRSTLSNGGDSSLGSIGRKASVNKDAEEDTYGINHLETEEELQALLNETPFTETDKRKKIRGRIRDIRNHKLGLGEPVVIKRPGRSTTLDDSEKENVPKARSSEPEPVKNADEPASSYRSSYRSRYAEPEVSTGKSKPECETDSYDRKDSYGRKNSYERKDSYGSRRANRYELDRDETTKAAKEPKTEVEDTKPEIKEVKQDIEVVKPVVEDSKTDVEDAKPDVEEEEEEEEEKITDDDMKQESADEQEEEGAEEDYVSEENVEEDQAVLDESEPVNGYDESIDEEEQKKYNDNDDQIKKKRGYSNDREDEEMGVEEDVGADQEDLGDEEEYSDNEEEADSKKKFQEVEEDEVPEEEYSDVDDDDDRSGDESDRKERSGSEPRSCGEQRDRVDSVEVEDEDYSDEETEERQRGSEKRQEEEYSDEGEYSESEDGSTYSKDDSKQTQSQSKAARVQQDYSDDYSEGYSDNTPTDDGNSSVGGKRYDEDQDLEGYDLERRSSQGNHHKQRSGVSYSAKVEEVFKQKDPRLAEGKDFKDLLKKSDNKPQAARTQVASKKGPEQVDFRTVLRSADKPKKLGEKGAGGPEQVDFRNMLQKKVKTKTLADKDLSAEQVDFRTVLAKPGAPPEKKTAAPRKTSQAEQLDFRNVLKKQPSVTSKLSRKLSIDDKNEIIRNIRTKKPTAVDKVKESAPSKSGRPSLDALRQGGKLEKAKEDLNRNRAESTGSESGRTERKSSRPSLDALKESGELGKTEDKKDKFEEMEKTAKKAPVPVPPKPTKKPATKVIQEEEVEPEITEEVEAEPEVEPEPELEPEPEVDISKKSDVKISKKSDVQQKTERKISIESKVTVEKKSTEQPRSRRVVRAEEETKTETKVETKSEPKRAERRSEKLASSEPDDKRASLKSGDKRARHRRLRQDQNEAVKDAVKKTEVNDVEKEVEVRKKSSSTERVAVVQSTASRPTVQVILSTNRRSSKDQGDDSDDEEIGVRRNRRRLLRKGSMEEQETTTHVSVTTTGPPIKEKKGTENKEKRGSSTGSSNADETDGKPARSAVRRQAEISTEVKKESSKVEVKSATDDSGKGRKEKMASLDAKLAARRRQRAMESKDKQQKSRNTRKAFKDQLESNAPTTNGSASPSVQRANSNMTKLLHWCQRMTDGYPNVEITNFSTSWNDGLAFCALLHNYMPDKIPFGDLSAKRPKENFEIAFSSAAEEGVAELLEVEDMVRMESPDPKSVITYLHSIYQVFVADRR